MLSLLTHISVKHIATGVTQSVCCCFSPFFCVIFFLKSVAVCDPLHDVETIHGLLHPEIFSEISVMQGKLQNSSFLQAPLIFKKRFPDAVIS